MIMANNPVPQAAGLPVHGEQSCRLDLEAAAPIGGDIARRTQRLDVPRLAEQQAADFLIRAFSGGAEQLFGQPTCNSSDHDNIG